MRISSYLRVILCISFAFIFSSTASAHDEYSCKLYKNWKWFDTYDSQQKVMEWKWFEDAGLFANLMHAVECMYSAKENECFILYLNMQDAYKCKDNVFFSLFKPFVESNIILQSETISYRIKHHDLPGNFPLRFYPTDGMKEYHRSKYIYQTTRLFKDPDFCLLRERLYPIISQYLQPIDELQIRIDSIAKQLNEPVSNEPITKVGIHVRVQQYYRGCDGDKSPQEFLDDIENDIDQIMRAKDSRTTRIYLATLLQPLVDRLSCKYQVIAPSIPRSKNVSEDWMFIPNANPLDIPRDAIVDAWSLANCDEVWSASSCMTLFAACLNPQLKLYTFPSLENYLGE